MKCLFEINEKYFPVAKSKDAGPDQAIWGENTKKIFNASEFYVPDDKDCVMVIESDQLEKEILLQETESQERSCLLLVEATEATEAATRKRAGLLCKRLGISRSLYSMVVNKSRQISRNLALNCIFNFTILPTVEDANHILTELRHPGLFTNTSEDCNRRNYVIKCVLGWANALQKGQVSEDILPPGSDWTGFLQMLLKEMNMESTTGLSATVNVPSLTDCESQVQALILDLRDKAEKLSPNDDNSLRAIAVEGYKKKNKLPSATAVYFDCLQNAGAFVTDIDHTRKILTGEERGSRDALIYLFSYLGCGLNEMNRILQQANYPLLYPRSRSEEEQEYLRLFSKIR